HLWDIAGGKEFHVLKGDTADPIRWAAFSPDGRLILTSSSYDGHSAGNLPLAPRVWDAAPGQMAAVLRHTGPTTYPGRPALAFSPDGRQVLTAYGHDALLWDAATGAQLGRLEHAGTVLQAAFSPDGRHVATAASDQAVRLWDAATGSEERVCKGHE